jgi:hypothetical protein
MKIVFILLIALTSGSPAIFQSRSDRPQPNWQTMSDWKLYRENNFNAVFRLPIDSLSIIQGGALSTDSIKTFLTGVEKIEGVNPQWMGCYLASCKDIHGKIYKVIVSHYGGFFYNAAESSYYQVSPSQSRDWLLFFSNAYMRLFINTQKKS